MEASFAAAGYQNLEVAPASQEMETLMMKSLSLTHPQEELSCVVEALLQKMTMMMMMTLSALELLAFFVDD